MAQTDEFKKRLEELGLGDPPLEVEKMTDEELLQLRFVWLSTEDEAKVIKESERRKKAQK